MAVSRAARDRKSMSEPLWYGDSQLDFPVRNAEYKIPQGVKARKNVGFRYSMHSKLKEIGNQNKRDRSLNTLST